MAKNKNKAPKTQEVAAEVTVETVEAPVAKVPAPHNPAMIEWPTDIWGLTKDLKKEFLKAASRVGGQADKKALLDATLEIAHEHLEAKFEKDNAHLAARIEKAAAEEAAVAEESKEPTLF